MELVVMTRELHWSNEWSGLKATGVDGLRAHGARFGSDTIRVLVGLWCYQYLVK